MDHALCAMRYMKAVIDLTRRHHYISDEPHDHGTQQDDNAAAAPHSRYRGVTHDPKAPLRPGTILLAHPFMDDPRFRHSVVLLCRRRGLIHGIVINKPTRKRVKVVTDRILCAVYASATRKWYPQDLLNPKGAGNLDGLLGDVQDFIDAGEEERPNAVARLWKRVMLDDELQGRYCWVHKLAVLHDG